MTSSLPQVLTNTKYQLAEMLPLVLGVAFLTVTARLIAGDLAIPYWDWSRLDLMLAVLQMFIGSLLVLMLVLSLAKAKEFVRADSGEIDLGALWKTFNFNHVVACLAMMVAAYGMTSMGSLVEVYRVRSDVWYDTFLWSLESPLFSAFLNSSINLPNFWDAIYMGFWPGLALMAGSLQVGGHFRRLNELLLAAVVAFFLTRTLALLWPTAGPMFFAPEMFDLAGTTSAHISHTLMLYMDGDIMQTGWLPGTMAMPSLHVGLTGMAAWYLGREFRSSYWLTLPWVILIWFSTIFLGWHYILDGAGGLVVAAISVLVASRFTKFVNAMVFMAIKWQERPCHGS